MKSNFNNRVNIILESVNNAENYVYDLIIDEAKKLAKNSRNDYWVGLDEYPSLDKKVEYFIYKIIETSIRDEQIWKRIVNDKSLTETEQSEIYANTFMGLRPSDSLKVRARYYLLQSFKDLNDEDKKTGRDLLDI